MPDIKRFRLRFLWGIIILLGLNQPGQSEEWANGLERILAFTSHIAVQPDASLTVTETIVVRATGDQIKRGIVRNFPTIYTNRLGYRVKVGFKVLEARRNGAPEPYRVESAANGKKIYLGRKDIFLSPEVYTYTLTYRTTRQLGLFKDFDELYWNVTGHGWTFPIDRVKAEVALPPGATIKQYAAYTGVLGAKGQDFQAEVQDGLLVFTGTRGFSSGEGLTVAVAWPKGFVKEPTHLTRIRHFLEENPGATLVWLALLALLVYYLIVWVRVGRDPAQGLIIPLFEPPHGLSPAAVRMVKIMGFDDTAFAATLVNMAVRGALIIENNDGEFTLRRPHAGPPVLLTSVEKRILARLFRGKEILKLTAGSHENIKSAENALVSNLNWEAGKRYFLTNSGYFAKGVLLSLLALVLAVLLAGNRDSMILSGFLVLWLSVWTPVTISLWAAKGQKFLAVAFSFFAVLVIIIMFIFAPFVAAVFVLVVCINLLFHYLLKAYTVSGRRLMDQIEGFRMYLTAAEEDRLEILHPPEKTPALFEKYLPFALALDVENQWCQQFAEILDKAGYDSHWYQGSSWRNLGSGGLAVGLGSSLSSAIVSSASPPGSSSGSGGGGSSGGGGGGGGGSGW